MPSTGRNQRRWYLVAGFLVGVAALLAIIACGSDDDAPRAMSTTEPTPAPTSYTVVAGDRLADIAAQFDVSVAELVVANAIVDPNLIEVGQVLVIPAGEPLTAAGSPPPPLSCNDHRVLIDDALAAAGRIDEASSLGGGTQYAPHLDEIDRVSGLLSRRSEASATELNALLRLLARLAIDATRLSLGQVGATDAAIAATTAELSEAGAAVIADVCPTSSQPEPAPRPDLDDRPVHPSRATGVA